jgi:hypothetical protein
MSQSAAVNPTVEVASIPLAQFTPWALFFGLLASVVLFFVSTDQGATSLLAGNALHEWVHDGRHLLGYPCH